MVQKRRSCAISANHLCWHHEPWVRKQTHCMVCISITVRSYTNNLNERGLLVVGRHVSSFLVLSHLSHYRHAESEGNTGREEKTNASRTIDTRLHAIFARLHFRSQPEIGRLRDRGPSILSLSSPIHVIVRSWSWHFRKVFLNGPSDSTAIYFCCKQQMILKPRMPVGVAMNFFRACQDHLHRPSFFLKVKWNPCNHHCLPHHNHAEHEDIVVIKSR
jgi:hypothetical protein